MTTYVFPVFPCFLTFLLLLTLPCFLPSIQRISESFSCSYRIWFCKVIQQVLRKTKHAAQEHRSVFENAFPQFSDTLQNVLYTVPYDQFRRQMNGTHRHLLAVQPFHQHPHRLTGFFFRMLAHRSQHGT